MAAEPSEEQLMALYAVVREEARLLGQMRAGIDGMEKRLLALQGAIAREAGTAIGQAAKEAVKTVQETTAKSVTVAMGNSAGDLRDAAAAVTSAARSAEGQLREASWGWMLAMMLIGIVIGAAAEGIFVWWKIEDRFEAVLGQQDKVLQAVKTVVGQAEVKKR